MPGINEGNWRRKLARKQRQITFIQSDANFVNSFSPLLIGYLEKSIKLYILCCLVTRPQNGVTGGGRLFEGGGGRLF